MRSFVWAAGGTLFTFLMTTLGAAVVFFFKNPAMTRLNRACMGFAGGVMSAAAVFSLLLPAFESGKGCAVVSGSFLLGAGLMLALDALLGKLQAFSQSRESRGRALMIAAITLHNIPEGMAVGLAFALAAKSGPSALAGAMALALGVGVQNMPEGAAIALPLAEGGMSRRRSFLLGALSGAPEVLFGVMAALAAALLAPLMPAMMSLCAGAMIWVVFGEMLPSGGSARGGTAAAVIGFALMMTLDVALG